MPNGMISYYRKKAQKQKKNCANMRKAKERKRMESEPLQYPLDRSGDYRVIHIEDCMAGVITDHILLLSPVKSGQGRCDQFAVWLDAEYQGIMGWKRAYTLSGKQFFRVNSPE
jgi:hypothetical protein